MFFERLFRYSKTVPVIPFSCRRLYEHRWISLWNRYVSPHTFVRLLDLGSRNGLKEAAVFAPLRYLKNASAVGVEPDEEEAERLSNLVNTRKSSPKALPDTQARLFFTS